MALVLLHLLLQNNHHDFFFVSTFLCFSLFFFTPLFTSFQSTFHDFLLLLTPSALKYEKLAGARLQPVWLTTQWPHFSHWIIGVDFCFSPQPSLKIQSYFLTISRQNAALLTTVSKHQHFMTFCLNFWDMVVYLLCFYNVIYQVHLYVSFLSVQGDAEKFLAQPSSQNLTKWPNT